MKALAGLILLWQRSRLAQSANGDVHRHHRHGDGAGFWCSDYHLADGDTAHGPVIVIGGTATIDGHADDDVVVLGGRVRLGPQAVVDGEVVTVGGEADVNAQAQVHALGRL